MELKPQWNLIPIDLWFENCWWSFRAPYTHFLGNCLWVCCGCVSLLSSKVDQITLMRGYTWYTAANLRYLSLSPPSRPIAPQCTGPLHFSVRAVAAQLLHDKCTRLLQNGNIFWDAIKYKSSWLGWSSLFIGKRKPKAFRGLLLLLLHSNQSNSYNRLVCVATKMLHHN